MKNISIAVLLLIGLVSKTQASIIQKSADTKPTTEDVAVDAAEDKIMEVPELTEEDKDSGIEEEEPTDEDEEESATDDEEESTSDEDEKPEEEDEAGIEEKKDEDKEEPTKEEDKEKEAGIEEKDDDKLKEGEEEPKKAGEEDTDDVMPPTEAEVIADDTADLEDKKLEYESIKLGDQWFSLFHEVDASGMKQWYMKMKYGEHGELTGGFKTDSIGNFIDELGNMLISLEDIKKFLEDQKFQDFWKQNEMPKALLIKKIIEFEAVEPTEVEGKEGEKVEEPSKELEDGTVEACNGFPSLSSILDSQQV